MRGESVTRLPSNVVALQQRTQWPQLTKNFGKIVKTLTIPHLLNLQIDSYELFLQKDVPPTSREDAGLKACSGRSFPIEDFNRTASLEYVSYEIGEPNYDEPECIAKGLTFEAPLRIKVRLVVYDVDEETENRSIRDIKEQVIYFGTVPLMTAKGTFIINGTERVIVNQLQRSPGIIFEHDSGKSHTSRKVLYSCRVIPCAGPGSISTTTTKISSTCASTGAGRCRPRSSSRPWACPGRISSTISTRSSASAWTAARPAPGAAGILPQGKGLRRNSRQRGQGPGGRGQAHHQAGVAVECSKPASTRSRSIRRP